MSSSEATETAKMYDPGYSISLIKKNIRPA